MNEHATFGGGCFWGVEETFRPLDGVHTTEVGYAGGTTDAPSYEDVCDGNTGHAEVVHITFDPRRISYTALLDMFFNSHKPTELNRQGPDVGTQYRSVIFYHTPEQQRAASHAIEELERARRFDKPIVTAVEPFTTFYRAEERHQQYLMKRGQSSCRI